MKLSFSDYKDKLMGCWMGKNIGGVLGAPFECKRGMFDIDFYIQDLKGNPPPNDDLDLQLVWMNAVEKYGRQVNAAILGEYWLSFIIPDWVEYGAGKNNLRMGILPPLSGYLENTYRNSCGCFIRSEIWACLAPGRPELAARYAYEDAIVDHSGEGMYGEIFCAAVQSAAFVETDKYRLIEIGLSYIPDSCDVAKCILTAMEVYRSGAEIGKARIEVLSAAPGTFGVQGTLLKDIPEDVPQGEPGYDAPGNVGLIILGWLYGEDDFGKSLCIANNCGEDTDCTCATLGAILGIIHGRSGIPDKWVKPIGDSINTCCINLLNGGISIPKTVTELTDRILRLTPSFLGAEFCDILAGPDGYTIEVQTGEALFCEKEDLYIPGINGAGKSTEPSIPALLKRSPFAITYRFPTFNAVLDYMGDPYFKSNEMRKIRLTLTHTNNLGYQNHQWLNIKLYTPDGVEVFPEKECSFYLQTTYKHEKVLEFGILCERTAGSKLELLIDISVNGRHSNGIIKAVLIAEV